MTKFELTIFSLKLTEWLPKKRTNVKSLPSLILIILATNLILYFSL